MPQTPDIAAVIDAYLAAVSGGSAAAVAALYAPTATVEDPVGTAPHVGSAAIEAFYGGLASMDVSAELVTARIAGLEAAFHFRVTTRAGDRTYVVEPIDVMTFDEAGLITSMRAFWSPSDMSEE